MVASMGTFLMVDNNVDLAMLDRIPEKRQDA